MTSGGLASPNPERSLDTAAKLFVTPTRRSSARPTCRRSRDQPALQDYQQAKDLAPSSIGRDGSGLSPRRRSSSKPYRRLEQEAAERRSAGQTPARARSRSVRRDESAARANAGGRRLAGAPTCPSQRSGRGGKALAYAKDQLGDPTCAWRRAELLGCSGLTMLAWVGGVSCRLVGRVQPWRTFAKSDLQLRAGFFYSDITNVGLYAGNGRVSSPPAGKIGGVIKSPTCLRRARRQG